ncbi:MAG: hypothetical protein KAF27_11120 [Porphyrobacter sp.]|nr:hypothetical protein [Porphyrobacter sp.]
MKYRVLAGLALGLGLASPALALEHEVVIDHVTGPIAADYRGSVTVETDQVGTAGAPGRPSTLRCNWTAKLNVERVARVGETLRSQRSLTQDHVASGSRPGWCETNARAIDKLVDSRRDTIRTAMLALVEQDRATLLAEADNVAPSTRS